MLTDVSIRPELSQQPYCFELLEFIKSFNNPGDMKEGGPILSPVEIQLLQAVKLFSKRDIIFWDSILLSTVALPSYRLVVTLSSQVLFVMAETDTSCKTKQTRNSTYTQARTKLEREGANFQKQT